MTAVLQPGDVIHLALPVSPMLNGKERETQTATDYRTWEDFYRRFGIEVAVTSHHSQLAGPVVVAIIRKPTAEEPQP